MLISEWFSDPDWIYECKVGGERCLAYRAALYSRNRKSLDDSWPEVVDAFTGQQGAVVVDGEIVVFEHDRQACRTRTAAPAAGSRGILPGSLP
ncbi:hypothetical protein AB0E69_15625 [Kribbella sp. NPDC026611]|uniref:ATP-dependent DNA ligase n=1 Tax=Kribbella sp. NPDC026611 TaxID=3154911 RepID=UPI0033C85EB2